jgi:hypothetical protein
LFPIDLSEDDLYDNYSLESWKGGVPDSKSSASPADPEAARADTPPIPLQPSPKPNKVAFFTA